MNDFDLFTYTVSAGYRDTDTSFAAAQSIDAGTLRAKVLDELRSGPGTADEIAGRLGMSILSIRPRCTELKHLGRVVDTGIRRKNSSGRSAAVFGLVA